MGWQLGGRQGLCWGAALVGVAQSRPRQEPGLCCLWVISRGLSGCFLLWCLQGLHLQMPPRTPPPRFLVWFLHFSAWGRRLAGAWGSLMTHRRFLWSPAGRQGLCAASSWLGPEGPRSQAVYSKENAAAAGGLSWVSVLSGRSEDQRPLSFVRCSEPSLCLQRHLDEKQERADSGACALGCRGQRQRQVGSDVGSGPAGGLFVGVQGHGKSVAGG